MKEFPLMLLEAGCTHNVANVEGRTTSIDAENRSNNLSKHMFVAEN